MSINMSKQNSSQQLTATAAASKQQQQQQLQLQQQQIIQTNKQKYIKNFSEFVLHSNVS